MKMVDTTEKLFDPVTAERLAKKFQENDPDWRYVVKHDPKGTGLSFIEVYDENGDFVSKV